MADVTIYVPVGVVVDVQNGGPPVDQSALVASLQAEVAALNGKIAVARTAAQAAKDADAASVEGQSVLDALA